LGTLRFPGWNFIINFLLKSAAPERRSRVNNSVSLS
jgi:hypothetical protein